MRPKPNNEAPIIEVSGLTKTYLMGDVSIHALRGVDIALAKGELVVLLGASGSGKSTLLNIMGGLDIASSGTLTYSGRDLSSAGEVELTRFRREHVGFVFQFYNLIPSLTASENVALATDLAINPMAPAEALHLVGLSSRLNHFPSQLSGGEQQRVAIARAIAKRPAILMCDEPTGALDSKTGVIVLEAIDYMNREFKTSTVIISHNEVIGQMADRTVRLKDGLVASIDVLSERVRPSHLAW